MRHFCEHYVPLSVLVISFPHSNHFVIVIELFSQIAGYLHYNFMINGNPCQVILSPLSFGQYVVKCSSNYMDMACAVNLQKGSFTLRKVLGSGGSRWGVWGVKLLFSSGSGTILIEMVLVLSESDESEYVLSNVLSNVLVLNYLCFKENGQNILVK